MPTAVTEIFWKFDEKVGRYRYLDSGKFAPREAILNLTRGRVATGQQDLTAIANNLIDGKISLQQWQRQTAEGLRILHVQNAILGRGGADRMTSEDWLKVGRELKRQYYSGIDEISGKQYGLKHLAKELKEGKVTPAQFRNRVQMYASMSRVSFHQMQQVIEQDRGMTLMRRILGATDNHCADCVAYAGMGKQPIGKLPLPTQRCECKSRCLCRVIYYA